MRDIEVRLFSDGFNRVRAVRLHRAPPKIDQKLAPLQKRNCFIFTKQHQDTDGMSKKKKKIL